MAHLSVGQYLARALAKEEQIGAVFEKESTQNAKVYEAGQLAHLSVTCVM